MRVTLILAMLAVVACQKTPSAPSTIDGAWFAPSSVPGAGFSFNLTQVADSVTGEGQYRIEAGRAGTVTLRGQYAIPAVTLILSYDFGERQAFEGRVEGSKMIGTVTDSAGQSSAQVFIRQ